MPRVLVVFALALVLASVGLGCRERARFELFTVRELSSSRLDAGRRVVLRGTGFPVGRDVDVLLVGTLSQPLGRRSTVHTTLHGRTETPERVELALGDADIAAIGGRGTFRGRLEVQIAGAAVDGLTSEVVGTLGDVTLDVVPSEGRRRAQRSSQAVSLVEPLGLDVDDGLELDEAASRPPLAEAAAPSADASSSSDAPTTGAPTDARPSDVRASDATADDDELEDDALDEAELATWNGQAPTGVRLRAASAESGLLAGDRVIELDGLRVLGPEELVADGHASHAAFTVLRRGQPVHVVVDLERALGLRPASSLRYDQLAALIAIAALLFGTWPFGSRPVRGREAISSAPPESKPVASMLTGLFGLTVALAGTVLPTLAHDHLAGWVVAALGARMATWVAQSHAARGREGILVMLGALAASSAVGVFVLAAGSDESLALAHAGLVPLDWPLVRSAFGPLALAALVASAATSPGAIALGSTRTGRVLRALDDLGLALASAAFVRVAIADPATPVVAERALGLVATVVLFGALLHVRRATALVRDVVRGGAVAVLVVLTWGATIAWLEVEPDATLERAVGEVVLVAIGLLLVRVASLRAEPAVRARVETQPVGSPMSSPAKPSGDRAKPSGDRAKPSGEPAKPSAQPAALDADSVVAAPRERIEPGAAERSSRRRIERTRAAS